MKPALGWYMESATTVLLQSKQNLSVGLYHVVAEHGRLGKSHIGDASIRVISWLRTFVQKVGDRMLSSSDIHLPSCLTKADVYAVAADDLCQGGLKCCNMSTFYAI